MLRKRPTAEDLERAPYALPPGTPALQNDPAVTRRWVIVAGLAGVAGGALAVYAALDRGKQPSPGAPGDAPPVPAPLPGAKPTDPRLTWARELALGPFDELLAKHRTFLMVVDMNKHDELLWDGVERLAEHALAVSDPATLDMAEFNLLPTLRSPRAPSYLKPIRDRLESRVKNLRKGR